MIVDGESVLYCNEYMYKMMDSQSILDQICNLKELKEDGEFLVEKCFSLLHEDGNYQQVIQIGIVEFAKWNSGRQRQFQVKAMVTNWANKKSVILIFEELTSVVQSALEHKKQELTQQY